MMMSSSPVGVAEEDGAGVTAAASSPAPAGDAPALLWEEEICSICLDPLPRFAHEFSRLTCCGKGLHLKCVEQFSGSSCRETCPMCRAPTCGTKAEAHARCLGWANKGKVWAMYFVGNNYEYGRGVPQSDETARLWYGRAAELGEPTAQRDLGSLHLSGSGGPVSEEQARVWFEKAAVQGHPDAQFMLANMYAFGGGGLAVTLASLNQARLWCEKAAAQGHRSAQHIIYIWRFFSFSLACGVGIVTVMYFVLFWYHVLPYMPWIFGRLFGLDSGGGCSEDGEM